MTEPARPPAVGGASVGRAIAFVVAASATFALSGPLARLARPAHPMTIAFGRVALAGLVLAAVQASSLPAALRALPKPARMRTALAGAVLGLHFALFQWGLDETSLPAALSLVALEPVSVVFAAWIALGLRPRRLELLGVTVAMMGGLLVAQSGEQGEHRLFGDLLVLGAVVLFGVYVALARAIGDALPPRSYAALVYLSAAAALAPLLLVLPADAERVLWPLPPHALACIVGIALLPTVVGHTMVQAAARRFSPSVVGLVSPGETVGGIALGALVLAATPTQTELFGGALIVGGVAVTILGQRRRSSE